MIETRHLFSELDSAFTYSKRLIQVTAKLTQNVDTLGKTKGLLRECLLDILKSLSQKQHQSDLINKSQMDLLELEQAFRHIQNFLISSLELKMNVAATTLMAVEIINIIYAKAHAVHMQIDPNNFLKIQLPRVALIRILNNDDLKTGTTCIPKFHLPLQPEPPETKSAKLFSLNEMRKSKHENWIKRGHELISQKNFKEAMNSFMKANEIMKTAQSLTLLGWAHSLQGNLHRAKEYCFEAIKSDPDYGNPYNDIGSYLLSEGKIKESFSWFNLAKRAKYYLNREFPYINAAKAHLMQKNYKNALSEFKVALDLVPYHKDLQKTVKRLKGIVHRSNIESTTHQ